MDFLVAGLGNIGPEYARTRHNMGFMVLDAWSQASDAVFQTRRYGDLAEVTFKGRRFHLLKPSTYMNLSGRAVRYWMQALDLPLERLIVISDDLNLPFGSIRMRRNGSAGGHNGLEDIIECLETTEFTRIRLGIGNDFHPGDQIDFVLSELSPAQLEQMPGLCDRVIEGIKAIATVGPERAMNLLNTKRVAEK